MFHDLISGFDVKEFQAKRQAKALKDLLGSSFHPNFLMNFSLHLLRQRHIAHDNHCGSTGQKINGSGTSFRLCAK